MSDGNRNLTVIYPRTTTEENPPKRRVAAYCRVSTQAEEQSHSLAAQISYYTKLIEADDDAELVDFMPTEAPPAHEHETAPIFSG